ncbi:MAG: patatin-like phospholipase family protein [Desulfatibacillaceae bacterium]
MASTIEIRAGKDAIGVIRDRGLTPDMVKVLAGAAGGPKWLILGALDRWLFGEWFAGRTKPLYLLGSSIGAWRFAAASRADPVAALERFEAEYLAQEYSEKPDAAEVSAECRRILDAYVDGTAVAEILANPVMRPGILAVRCKGLAASDNRLVLTAGVGAAAAANLLSRGLMSWFFERVLFYHPGDPPPYLSMDAFPTERVRLDHNNLRRALLASGSIPLVMERERNIPGATPGTYRDGGLVDYQLDVPFLGGGKGIVLYPHFSARVTPGWFDKALRWRSANPDNMANVVLVSPAPEFVEALPGGKIPDRTDFREFAGRDRDRRVRWERAVSKSRQLADDFVGAVESGRIRDMVLPL